MQTMPVEVDKRILARHFSAGAARYDAAAELQRQLAAAVAAELAAVAPRVRDLLEIGCGTGFLTQGLAERFPQARLTAVDLAPGMIEAARRRLAGRPVAFLCADAEALTLPERFDAIASSATFQWFTRPEATLRRLAAHLRPSGLLVASIFIEGTLQELFAAFRWAEEELGVPPVPHGPRLLPAAAWCRLFEAAGLAVEAATVGEVVRTYPSPRAVVQAVKAIGANNAAGAAAPPRVVRAMLRLYEERFGDGQGVPATYRHLLIRGRAAGGAGTS